MQNSYTSGHRQLMLDCLDISESEPSQQETQVVIVQRLLARGRSMLNVLEVHDAIIETGATVQVFSTEGENISCAPMLSSICIRMLHLDLQNCIPPAVLNQLCIICWFFGCQYRTRRRVLCCCNLVYCPFCNHSVHKGRHAAQHMLSGSVTCLRVTQQAKTWLGQSLQPSAFKAVSCCDVTLASALCVCLDKWQGHSLQYQNQMMMTMMSFIPFCSIRVRFVQLNSFSARLAYSVPTEGR